MNLIPHSPTRTTALACLTTLLLVATMATPASAGIRQDVVMQVDEMSLIEADFITIYTGQDASLMRRGADALGNGDGMVSGMEAMDFSQRAAAELEGQRTTRAFLDGFQGVQLRPMVRANGMEGDVNNTGAVELITSLLLVMPSIEADRHLLVMVPSQPGTLEVVPPDGWRVARVKGAEPQEAQGRVRAALDEASVLAIELVPATAATASVQGDGATAGAGPVGAEAPDQAGRNTPALGAALVGTAVLLAAAAYAGTAAHKRSQQPPRRR